jgi:two-component system, OmpR family, alkaline phosphatase synthesis response regulator PhoP
MQEIKDLRILVAEENPVTQRVLSNMLLYCGHKPSKFADTPETALENLQNDEIDLALLNWNIVSANDFILLKEVQEKQVFETMPLVIMVPGMDEELIAIASKFGAKSYIPKPIPAHLLPEKIEEAVLSSPRTMNRTQEGNGSVRIPLPSQEQAPSLAHAVEPRQALQVPNAEDATAKARKLYGVGRKALSDRNYTAAAQAFADALQLKPNFPEACKGLGLSHRGLGDMHKARHFCNKAALIYVRAGRFQDAARLHAEYSRAGLKPLNPFKVMADMHKSNGNAPKALELYEHGAALTPADPMIAYNLFLLHRKSKKHKKALAVLSRLLEASTHVRDRKNLQWCESAYRKLTGLEWGRRTAPILSTKTVQTPAASGDRKTGVAEDSPGPTILIVDDEPHIRMLLERSLEPLEDEGATLLFAANGEEGLRMIKDRRPELVFLDVMMPRMNGFEVCRIVKHELGMSDIYVIMLTAKGQEFDRKKGLEAGADVYMTKPFRPRELANLARAVLDM